MDFPGHIVRSGEPNPQIVNHIAQRLRRLGFAAPPSPDVFDGRLRSAVKLFQSRHNDAEGRPLTVDGEVGPATWSALFGAGTAAPAGSALARAALRVAAGEVGAMEDPPGSNRGARVEQYLASTGTAPGNFWCMAFVYFCFREAAASLGVPVVFPRTAGCIDAWTRAPGLRLTRQAAMADPSRVLPGSVFILDFGGGAGHTGFVEANSGGLLTTIEGNSNDSGSANGIGVFRLRRRNLANTGLKGFLIVP